LADSGMSNKDRMNNADSQKTHGHSNLLRTLVFGIVVIVSAWSAFAYFHVASLQEYVTNIIKPADSLLRITLIVTFGGFISSIPILRSLSRKDKTPQAKVQPIPQYRSPQVHPLFMTPRPARDTSFVIRKTKNKGRISRNRDGERLPPSHPE
jgi:hypothetical protein